MIFLIWLREGERKVSQELGESRVSSSKVNFILEFGWVEGVHAGGTGKGGI